MCLTVFSFARLGRRYVGRRCRLPYFLSMVWYGSPRDTDRDSRRSAVTFIGVVSSVRGLVSVLISPVLVRRHHVNMTDERSQLAS